MERWFRATGVATRTIVRALDVRLQYPIGLAAHERDRWARFLTRHDVWDIPARRYFTYAHR